MSGWQRYGKQLVFVAWALFFAGGLAGCLGSEGGDLDADMTALVEEPVVGLEIEHEAGTARELNTEYITRQADRCSALGQTLGEVCIETVSPALSEVPKAGGVPAPHLDVLAVTLAETSTDLIVTMEISELDEEWNHVQEGTILNYVVGWERDGMDEGPLFAVRNWDGAVHLSSKFYTVGPECNDYWICETPASYEIEYGSPATIKMTIPRAAMLDAEQGTQFNNTGFGTWVTYGRYASLGWQFDSDNVEERGQFGAWTAGMVDEGGFGPEHQFTITTPLAPFDPAQLTVTEYEHFEGGTYDHSGAYRSDIDILSVRIEESDTTLTLQTKLANVDETPDDHGVHWSVGMPSGRVHEIGYSAKEGERAASAGYYDVSEGNLQWVDHPVEMSLVSGAPGWVNFTLDRTDLGSPQKNERLGLAWIRSGIPGLVGLDETAGPMSLRGGDYLNDRTAGGDWIDFALTPFWFHLDTAQKEAQAIGIKYDDEAGDAQLPPAGALDERKAAQYDITYAKIEGHDTDTVRASIGIEDLSSISVPLGYEAIVYAMGIESEKGQFQAFFIKGNERQDYYCSPDTLVFGADPVDPRQTVLTPISGIQSGGDAGGAITFYIPIADCLRGLDQEPFRVTDVAAGTYLLEERLGLQGPSPVFSSDSARPDEEGTPFLLGIMETDGNEAREPAWYMTPLGLGGQDWDILGIVVAILLATGGAFVVYQRRRKLRRYLSRVSHTAKIKDLTARETGLGELREALRADLVAGKIAESHYTIVLRHIEDAMKDVRVKSIEETFRELPFHVVSKLRAVLDDGVITQDEREMVMDLVDRAEIPVSDKQKVLSRLERWQLVDEVTKA